MKEILIQIRVDGKHIATAIKKEGFDESASSTLEVIGILQNLLSTEQDKLKTIASATLPE
jgi:hypothetical protein